MTYLLESSGRLLSFVKANDPALKVGNGLQKLLCLSSQGLRIMLQSVEEASVGLVPDHWYQ